MEYSEDTYNKSLDAKCEQEDMGNCPRYNPDESCGLFGGVSCPHWYAWQLSQELEDADFTRVGYS